MIRFGLTWGPAALWLAVLFLLSAQPDDATPSWWQVNDKVAHLILYAVLGSTLAWGRHLGRLANAWSPDRLSLWLFGFAWAISDEWHQSFVPGRTASTGDVAADVAGLTAGLLVAGRLLPAFLEDLPVPGRDRPEPSNHKGHR